MEEVRNKHKRLGEFYGTKTPGRYISGASGLPVERPGLGGKGLEAAEKIIQLLLIGLEVIITKINHRPEKVLFHILTFQRYRVHMIVLILFLMLYLLAVQRSMILVDLASVRQDGIIEI